MQKITSLPWFLVLGLGTLALVRPVVNIAAAQVGWDRPPAVPVTLSLVISAAWIAVVGFSRIAQPILTLVCTGLTYAVLALALSGVLSVALGGILQGPLANPIAIVPMLIVNAGWGLVTGVLALLLQRARGVPSTPASPQPQAH